MSYELQEMILKSQTEEVTSARVPVLSEKRFAQLRRPDAIEHHGRWWRPADASKGLLYVPVNPLAIIKKEEASFPTIISLGYRATIEGIGPNASVHLHILRDLENFSPARMNKFTRRDLGRVARNPEIKITKLTRDNLMTFVDQAPEVNASSSAVQEYAPGSNQTCKSFEVGLEAAGFHYGELLIFAGLVNDRLAGYVTGMAIDNTAIAEMLVVSDEYKATNIGSRLMYALIQAAQRTEGIDQIYNWSVEPSKPGISQYKERMGFPAIAVPSTVVLRKGLQSVFKHGVRRVKPELYKKLYGDS